MHVDTHIDTESQSVDKVRTAKVTKTDKRGPIGVPVFFTADELDAHGIDLNELDRVAIRVDDGVIMFVAPDTLNQSE